jgi:hypothetical protein
VVLVGGEHVIGILIWYARSLLMKFSIAPESSSDSISALLDAMCMYALMVIDFLSNKYTWSSVPLLIQAAQIRAFKNPIPLSLRLGLHNFGVVILYLLVRGPGLWPGVLLWGYWFVLVPSVVIECVNPAYWCLFWWTSLHPSVVDPCLFGLVTFSGKMSFSAAVKACALFPLCLIPILSCVDILSWVGVLFLGLHPWVLGDCYSWGVLWLN